MRMIKIADEIKREIAERVVQMAHPGYSWDYMGCYYVVDGAAVMHAQGNRPWNPWHDDANVIAVDDLVNIYGGGNLDHADFDPSPDDEVSEDDAYEAAVDFAEGYIPDEYDADADDEREG